MDALEVIQGDDQLRSCALVRALSDAGLRRLFEESAGKRFADQAPIYREGDANGGVFLVLRGEVRLTSKRGAEPVDFAGALRGELFGEDCTDGPTRSYSAIARGDTD